MYATVQGLLYWCKLLSRACNNFKLGLKLLSTGGSTKNKIKIKASDLKDFKAGASNLGSGGSLDPLLIELRKVNNFVCFPPRPVIPVADPGFPIGGMDSQGSYISKILYVKTKESGPLGTCVPGMPPTSTNASIQSLCNRKTKYHLCRLCAPIQDHFPEFSTLNLFCQNTVI